LLYYAATDQVHSPAEDSISAALIPLCSAFMYPSHFNIRSSSLAHPEAITRNFITEHQQPVINISTLCSSQQLPLIHSRARAFTAENNFKMTSIDQPLNNKILLITGGASGTHFVTRDCTRVSPHQGIGLNVTKQAHAIGTRVLVVDIKTTPDFDSFAAGKDNIVYVQADVTRWSDFDKLFKTCEEKWNDVPDAYAICAGLFDPPFSNFWQDPEKDEGYMQVDVNVNHPIKLTRLAIRQSLGKGKRASVCIIVSCAK
jgi:hypothetical protein